MISLVLGDLILESLTPSVNAPLVDYPFLINFCISFSIAYDLLIQLG
jgi:hypothetical protein